MRDLGVAFSILLTLCVVLLALSAPVAFGLVDRIHDRPFAFRKRRDAALNSVRAASAATGY